jgi:TonB-dependent SusC/RagA subfamily outer membrane receptor
MQRHTALAAAALLSAAASPGLRAQEPVDTALPAVMPLPDVVNVESVGVVQTGAVTGSPVMHADVTVRGDSTPDTASVNSVTDLLVTRVPGMTVTRVSGNPGEPSRLRLRGKSNADSTNPVVIVDGVRVYSKQPSSKPGKGQSSSPLDKINPNDIETIEVFKGPSATALYGPDAAGGVIVVTTKAYAKSHARKSK